MCLAATSSVRQEIDGKEALRFALTDELGDDSDAARGVGDIHDNITVILRCDLHRCMRF